MQHTLKSKIQVSGIGLHTGKTITTGDADVKSHPPTDTMNKVAGDRATSSQDTQRQQQGQPTAAQQAEGAKQTQTADQGC